MLWKLSVSIGPGATTFTVIPCGASSSAQVRAMPSMPALLAEYAVRVGSPSTARDDTSTTRPNSAAFIAGRQACSRITAAEICRLTSAFRSSTLTSGSRAGRIVPALWISVVTWCFFAISAAAQAVAAGSVRSTARCLTPFSGLGFRSSEITWYF